MFIRFSQVINLCTLLCAGLYIFSNSSAILCKMCILWYYMMQLRFGWLFPADFSTLGTCLRGLSVLWSLGKKMRPTIIESSHFDDKGHLALGIHLQHFEEIYSKGYFWWNFHLLCFHPLFPSFPIMSLLAPSGALIAIPAY